MLGVTTYDRILITQHILGVKSLGSPYQILAADVNRSRSVTTLDLIQLRKIALRGDGVVESAGLDSMVGDGG